MPISLAKSNFIRLTEIYKKPEFDGKLVQCKTTDGLELQGLFRKNPEDKTAVMFVHGTASAYALEDFEPALDQWCIDNDYAYLSTNNRGAHVLDDWQISGSAVEKFSDANKDFLAWLKFLKAAGIESVILCGHSLGTEKIVHFMKTENHKMVQSMILLSPADTVGCQDRYEKKIGKNYFKVAKNLVDKNQKYNLLPDEKAHAGVLPISAEAYLDFFSPDSELREALPFRKENKDCIEKFTIPTIAIVPDNDMWNITSAEDYAEKLREAGAKVKIVHCDHDLYMNISPIITKLMSEALK